MSFWNADDEHIWKNGDICRAYGVNYKISEVIGNKRIQSEFPNTTICQENSFVLTTSGKKLNTSEIEYPEVDWSKTQGKNKKFYVGDCEF